MTPERKHLFDEVLLNVAEQIGTMSVATRAKVGAILYKNKNIISMGWNGLPSGMPNDLIESREGDKLITNPRVRHAEDNVFDKLIYDGNHSGAAGATLYQSYSPCPRCADRIIASGVARIVFRNFYRDQSALPWIIDAGISLEQLSSDAEYPTIITREMLSIPPSPPEPPPNRILCNACGPLVNGKHTSFICRMLQQLDKALKE